MTATPTPLFTRHGPSLRPEAASSGPWGPKTMSGRSIVGLLAAELERSHGQPDFVPARFTVDMHRMPDLSPVEVRTEIVRSGGRILVVDAQLISGGVAVARATCQMLRRSANPEGEIWAPPAWAAAPPLETPLATEGRAGTGLWEQRLVSGVFGQFGQKRFWMRELRHLIGDEPLTPFVRAAMVADFVSPYAHSGTVGLRYINSDVTLHLHRLPVGEWIGMETTDHQAADGVAYGAARLYDEAGVLGASSCVALAQSRAPGAARAT